MSDPDPQQPLGELSLRKWIHFQYTLSLILILKAFALFHDISNEMNVLDLSGSAVLYIFLFEF